MRDRKNSYAEDPKLFPVVSTADFEPSIDFGGGRGHRLRSLKNVRELVDVERPKPKRTKRFSSLPGEAHRSRRRGVIASSSPPVPSLPPALVAELVLNRDRTVSLAAEGETDAGRLGSKASFPYSGSSGSCNTASTRGTSPALATIAKASITVEDDPPQVSPELVRRSKVRTPYPWYGVPATTALAPSSPLSTLISPRLANESRDDLLNDDMEPSSPPMQPRRKLRHYKSLSRLFLGGHSRSASDVVPPLPAARQSSMDPIAPLPAPKELPAFVARPWLHTGMSQQSMTSSSAGWTMVQSVGRRGSEGMPLATTSAEKKSSPLSMSCATTVSPNIEDEQDHRRTVAATALNSHVAFPRGGDDKDDVVATSSHLPRQAEEEKRRPRRRSFSLSAIFRRKKVEGHDFDIAPPPLPSPPPVPAIPSWQQVSAFVPLPEIPCLSTDTIASVPAEMPDDAPPLVPSKTPLKGWERAFSPHTPSSVANLSQIYPSPEVSIGGHTFKFPSTSSSLTAVEPTSIPIIPTPTNELLQQMRRNVDISHSRASYEASLDVEAEPTHAPPLLDLSFDTFGEIPWPTTIVDQATSAVIGGIEEGEAQVNEIISEAEPARLGPPIASLFQQRGGVGLPSEYQAEDDAPVSKSLPALSSSSASSSSSSTASSANGRFADRLELESTHIFCLGVAF